MKNKTNLINFLIFFGILWFVFGCAGIDSDSTTNPTNQRPPDSSPVTISLHAAELVKEFETNEVRANQQYLGKRVRIYGTVNSVDKEKDGQLTLTFRSSVTTYSPARCYFHQSQSSRLAEINANQEATVEGTVKGLGGGFYETKFFLVLENCTIP